MSSEAAKNRLAPFNTEANLIGLIVFFCAFALLFLRHDWEAFFCYLVFGGPVQIVVISLASAVFFAAMPRGEKLIWNFDGFIAFNFWLLLFGLIGDQTWLYCAENRLYVTHNPFVEWLPFVPPGDWTIDKAFHGSLTAGTTWDDMYWQWFVIAVPVWIFAIVAYRWSKPLLAHQPVKKAVRVVAGVVAAFAVVSMVIFG